VFKFYGSLLNVIINFIKHISIVLGVGIVVSS